MLGKFIGDLQQQLGGELPGLAQQRLMSATAAQKIDFKHKEPPREGGVLILIYPDNGQLKIPLILRPEYDGAHGGQISLPGGKIEPQDQDLTETALRESYEEIGVPMDSVTVLGSLTKLYIIASNYDVLPVIGFTKETPKFIPDPTEVEKVITADVWDFANAEKKKRKDLLIRNSFRLDAPYYDIDNHVVWGATAMIMSEFEALLQGIKSDYS